MRRVLSALREWLELRARLREERRFHMDQAAAEFHEEGMSPRAAKRNARLRFGNRGHLKLALRELGGDLPGLAYLLRAHRVPASAWLQPALLIALIGLILFSSPAPRVLVEGLVGTPLASDDRDAVFLAGGGRNPWDTSITARDFELLRTLATVSRVERYQTIHARAQAARGATLAEIESEARAKTGNPRLWVGPLFAETRLLAGPAEVVWVLILFYVVLLLSRPVAAPNAGRWHVYGFVVALLHALGSLVVWAATIRLWAPSSTAGLRFGLLFVAFLLLAAVQCRYWWNDLSQRCPVCLDRLILPLTGGTEHRILLDTPIRESVCAHGHGVLEESRWSRRFRPEQSPLGALVRVS
jgi:hypothetical protein